MITITISGKQGEGKTKLMRLISKILKAMEYSVVTEEDLQGAELQGADLLGANLWRANLQGADTRDLGHVATFAPQSIYMRTKQEKAKV